MIEPSSNGFEFHQRGSDGEIGPSATILRLVVTLKTSQRRFGRTDVLNLVDSKPGLIGDFTVYPADR